MGIQQIGVRKKILDGIHMVHKREWEKESLPTVKYNKKMRQVSELSLIWAFQWKFKIKWQLSGATEIHVDVKR